MCALTLLLGAHVSWAQDAHPLAETGIQPNRDYLRLLPFEAIDTSSSNVVLTFNDLSLPDNAGRTLTFQRMFNRVATFGDEAPWRFGIAGIPLIVEEPNIPEDPGFDGTIISESIRGAHFEMLDGSKHYTTLMTEPQPLIQDPFRASLRWWRTPSFWKYDRNENKLYLPDGMVARYDDSGHLDYISDPFDNRVTLTWGTDSLQVVQDLGQGQSRLVSIAFVPSTLLPLTMTYDGKTWTYLYEIPDRPRALTRVIPPAGPDWQFEYDFGVYGRLARVITPQRGRITYTYGDQPFVEEPAPITVLVTRTTDGPGTEGGTWTFQQQIDEAAPSASRTTVTTPEGTRLVLKYSGLAGSLAGGWTVTDRFVYDANDQEVEREHIDYVTLQAGRKSFWTSPAISKRTITRDARQYVTEYIYSSSNFGDYHRPETLLQYSGGPIRATTIDYDHYGTGTDAGVRFFAGMPRSETVTIGNDSVSRFWTFNQATGFKQSETASNITTTFSPDGRGNVASVSRPGRQATTFSYSWGQVSATQTPEHVTTRAINPDGTVASESQAGRTTSYDYDALGRVTVVDPPGESLPTVTNYDNTTGRTITTTRGNAVLTATLDGFGRPIETEDGAGIRTKTQYDSEGRIVKRGYPHTGSNNIFTEIEYDALDRVVAERNPGANGGSVRTRSYGADTITLTDENQHSTTYTREAFGHPDDARIANLQDADGKNWRYTYDAAGNLRQVFDHDDTLVREWVYNAFNLLESETHPESGTTTYAYDSAGVLWTKKDANDVTLTYNYDGNDRLKSITGGGRTVTIDYEAETDNRKKTTVDGLVSEFTYESSTGRLAARTDTIDGQPFVTTFGYDGSDNLTGLTYPSGRRIGYLYDAENRLTQVLNVDREQYYAKDFTYHPSGALTSYRAGNGIVTEIGYDPNRYWVSSISAGPLQLAYSYDPVGNVTAIQDGRSNYNQTFTYDFVDRLQTATGPWGSTITYTYDAHGNRQTEGALPFNYYPNNRFRLHDINGGAALGYDDNGNLRTGPGFTYDYTSNNLLRRATTTQGVTWYEYDADDWRLKKSTENGPTLYYVRGPNGQLLMEFENSSPTAKIKDYIYAGSRLIAVVPTGGAPFDPEDPPTPISSQVSLRALKGHYVSPQNSGGGTVLANGPAVGTWEVLTLEDLNGNDLEDGDTITLRAGTGHYLQAVSGGGGTMLAAGSGLGPWETFTIISLTTPGGRIMANDTIALRSSNSYYVVAENGGGGIVNVNRTEVGAWETFTLVDANNPPPPPPSVVSLQAEVGLYLSPQNNGGGAVLADGPAIGPWETLTIGDLNGGFLWDGDSVTLSTTTGYYLQAVDGGGTTLDASSTAAGVAETFTIVSLTHPDGRIEAGDAIALRSINGYYVVAEGGGGGAVNVNREEAGPWETFTLVVH